MSNNRILKQSGVTVVELMVALVLSLILMAGVLQVYFGSKTTYRITEGLSRLQENTRASAEMLAKEIRMAGYVPCSQPQNAASIVDSSEWWADFFDTPIRGYEGDTSTASFPVSDAVIGSDAIMILRGGSKVAGVKLYDQANRQFVLQRDVDTNWVEDGSLMIACDSTSARLFQAENIGTNTISVADDNADPGNNGTINRVFGYDSQISNYSAVIYYIKASPSGNGNSLYRSYLNINNDGEAAPLVEELAEGIESMQLLYGYDGDDDGNADQYINADNPIFNSMVNWQNVATVKIGLLYASDDGIREGNSTDNNVYVVANTPIGVGTSTTVTHPQDQRKRYVASMTVSLRNL